MSVGNPEPAKKQTSLTALLFSFAVDNGESVPLSSSEIADFFLRKTQMDKAWRQEQRESIEYLHTYKNSAMADTTKSFQSTAKNSCPTIYSQMDPFYQQQRALHQEWKRQQQVSMAFLHNYRDAAGLNGTAVESGTNTNPAIVTPAHDDEGHDTRISEYDIDVAIRFHELQKSLDERMTLAVNTPLPPDDDESLLTITESVKEIFTTCGDFERKSVERDENAVNDCCMATHDEQPRPMDPANEEVLIVENDDDSEECLEKELGNESPTLVHVNLQDESADETNKDCIDDMDDIDEVLDDLLCDTYEQDDEILLNERHILTIRTRISNRLPCVELPAILKQRRRKHK